jgi:hypothetical protein
VTRRGWITTGVVVLVAGLGSVPMNFGGESARRRAGRYFDVEGPVDTATLRAAVLRPLPVGTEAARIDDFVRDRRIGIERGTAYFEIPSGLGIRIDDRSGPIQLVTGTYFIDLDLDARHRLRDVGIREVFTGP